MRPHGDPLPRQKLLCHCPGKDQRCRQPPGEVSPSPVVVIALIAHKAGVVPVPRTGADAQGIIIPAVLVAVADDGAQGGSRGKALKHAGEDFRLVRLPAGSGKGAVSRCAALQLPAHGLHVQLYPAGQTLYHHADGSAVALPENPVVHSLSSSMRPPAAA